MADAILKRCRQCAAEKPLAEYHRCSSARDGVQQKCKVCACAIAREWTAANTRRLSARHREYFQKNKAAATAKNAAWQRANGSLVAMYGKKYREANKEKERLRAARYREAHKAEALVYRQMYRAANPEKLTAWDAKRNASQMQATPDWANEFFIVEAYHLAKLRETVCGGKWHVDHIVPLQSKLVCGLHVEHNLQVIPQTVNQRKSNRHWPDMP